MKHSVLLLAVLFAGLLLFLPASLGQQLPKEKISNRDAQALMKTSIDMRDFSKLRLTMHEALRLLKGRLAGRGKKFPYFFDRSSFLRENPDSADPLDAQISFAKAPKVMTVYAVVNHMTSKIPTKNGAFVYHRGHIVITTKATAKRLQFAQPLDVPIDVKGKGAFGFPQGQATVLCNNADLRLSAWNDADYLYVQAVLWTDDSDALGSVGDKRTWIDIGEVILDVNSDAQVTPRLDRFYRLVHPRKFLADGVYMFVTARGGYSSAPPSKWRGAIRYVNAGKRRVRVDSFVMPLAELGRRPGDNIRLAYLGYSPKPLQTVTSIGYRKVAGYYDFFKLSWNRFHRFQLADRKAVLDLNGLPTDKR